jgi:hypothetical protein
MNASPFAFSLTSSVQDLVIIKLQKLHQHSD